MNEAPFHTTRMGHTFYERDVPRLVEALQQIARELHELNGKLRTREVGDDRPHS